MVSVKGVALNIVTAVFILMLPYLVAIIFDLIFAQLGATGFSLISTVTPLYVLALRLFLIGTSFAFEILDVMVNIIIEVLNLIPSIDITFRLDTSNMILSLSDQIDTAILDFLVAFGIVGKTASTTTSSTTNNTSNYTRN